MVQNNRPIQPFTHLGSVFEEALATIQASQDRMRANLIDALRVVPPPPPHQDTMPPPEDAGFEEWPTMADFARLEAKVDRLAKEVASLHAMYT